MWMVAAYRWTDGPSWFIWSVGWRPPAAFIKWTGWTVTAACYDDSNINIIPVIIIRPNCSTMYVDAACCYRPSSVVCRSVCRGSEPCKNGWTNQECCWAQGTTYYVRSRSPMEIDNFEGGKGRPIVKYRYCLLNWLKCSLGCGLGTAQGSTVWHTGTAWRIRLNGPCAGVRQLCGMLLNYFDHLLLL